MGERGADINAPGTIHGSVPRSFSARGIQRVCELQTPVGNIEPAYQQATGADLIRSLHISSNCSPSSPLEQVGSPRPGKLEKHASDNRVPSCLDVDCSVSGSMHKTARGLTPYLRRQRQQQKTRGT